LRDHGLGAEGCNDGHVTDREEEEGMEEEAGQGNNSGDNGGRCPSNELEVNASDYDMVHLSVLVQKSEMIEESLGPLWRADASEELTTFTILANLGKPCKVTASKLETGARFENLLQAIEGNSTNSVRSLTISNQDLIATFKIPPETDEDRKVNV